MKIQDISLRDWFAGQALVSISRLPVAPETASLAIEAAAAKGLSVDQWAADLCYELADAMLERRERHRASESEQGRDGMISSPDNEGMA